MNARDEARAALAAFEEDPRAYGVDRLIDAFRALLDEPVPDDEREALTDLIDGCIPDDIPGYRQRYTDKAVESILAAGFRRQGPAS
jgi:hypothetical protein